MGKNKSASGHDAMFAEVERALVLKAMEIGGHVRNINDAAASVLHILRTSLQVPGMSSLPHTVEQWSSIETVCPIFSCLLVLSTYDKLFRKCEIRR